MHQHVFTWRRALAAAALSTLLEMTGCQFDQQLTGFVGDFARQVLAAALL